MVKNTEYGHNSGSFGSQSDDGYFQKLTNTISLSNLDIFNPIMYDLSDAFSYAIESNIPDDFEGSIEDVIVLTFQEILINDKCVQDMLANYVNTYLACGGKLEDDGIKKPFNEMALELAKNSLYQDIIFYLGPDVFEFNFGNTLKENIELLSSSYQ